jgi:hypothetical protein
MEGPKVRQFDLSLLTLPVICDRQHQLDKDGRQLADNLQQKQVKNAFSQDPTTSPTTRMRRCIPRSLVVRHAPAEDERNSRAADGIAKEPPCPPFIFWP